MNTLIAKTQPHPLSLWHDPLTIEGFQPNGDTYVFNGVSVAAAGSWFLLSTPITGNGAKSPDGQIGQPGFWKQIEQKAGPVQLFEFPQAALGEAGSPADAGSHDTSLGAFLRWALATRVSEIPPNWRPPPRSLVERWLPTGGLTVLSGPHVCHGELILEHNRWAVRFVLIADVPPSLPQARRRCLEDVLAEVQSAWRFVRVGIAPLGEGEAVIAEVDFSGAPNSEFLFLSGLEAVRNAVADLIESSELLAAASVASKMLAIPPQTKPTTNHTKPKTKNQKP